MATKKSKKSAIDTRIERAYYQTCNGIQIGIMDIPKVYDHARAALDREPFMDDDKLGRVIRAYVETLRKN